MPLGNDPTPQAELAREFGVTSNAEELINSNKERFPRALREALNLPVTQILLGEEVAQEGDPKLGDTQRDDDAVSKLEDHVGHSVLRAVVRGTGARRVITYSYVDDRGSTEKGYVPYAELFGTAKEKREARAGQSPDEAAEQAAAAKLQEAEEKAAQILKDAQEKASKALEEAQRAAQEAQEEAQAKIAKIEADAQEKAAKAAEAAEKKAQREAAKAK
jgi:flagellar biosynthesis GTPase FlhF